MTLSMRACWTPFSQERIYIVKKFFLSPLAILLSVFLSVSAFAGTKEVLASLEKVKATSMASDTTKARLTEVLADAKAATNMAVREGASKEFTDEAQVCAALYHLSHERMNAEFKLAHMNGNYDSIDLKEIFGDADRSLDKLYNMAKKKGAPKKQSDRNK
jgi:hypothetical protein